MRVLACDPGKKLGWAKLDSEEGLLAYGVFESKDSNRFTAQFEYYDFLIGVADGMDAVGCEEVLSGAFRLPSSAAVFWLVGTYTVVGQVAADRRLELITAHPTTLKKHITGSGRATKEQVLSAVSAKYSIKLKASESHIADAIALADYILETKAAKAS